MNPTLSPSQYRSLRPHIEPEPRLTWSRDFHVTTHPYPVEQEQLFPTPGAESFLAPAHLSFPTSNNLIEGYNVPIYQYARKEKLERRKAQNRASQKAYRERKETQIKTLTKDLMTYQGSVEAVNLENEKLRAELSRLHILKTDLEMENEDLKSRRSSGPSSCNVGNSSSGRTGEPGKGLRRRSDESELLTPPSLVSDVTDDWSHEVSVSVAGRFRALELDWNKFGEEFHELQGCLGGEVGQYIPDKEGTEWVFKMRGG